MAHTPTEKLIAWMERHSLKQVDLARRMNISESAVSLIVNGHREPTDFFAGRFAKTFGVTAFTEIFGSPAPAEAVPA